MKKSRAKKAVSAGFTVHHNPFNRRRNSRSRQRIGAEKRGKTEYWDRIKNKKELRGAYIGGGMPAYRSARGPHVYFQARGFDSCVRTYKDGSFATQYLQPTNVTYDGQNLWRATGSGRASTSIRSTGSWVSLGYSISRTAFLGARLDNGTLWSATRLTKRFTGTIRTRT